VIVMMVLGLALMTEGVFGGIEMSITTIMIGRVNWYGLSEPRIALLARFRHVLR